MYKRFHALASLGLVLALGLSACGGGQDGKAQKAQTRSAEELKAILSAKPSGQKIVVATNNNGSEREAWLQESASKAGFNIEVVPLGGGAITARVIAESSNPTLNVVWGPSEEQFASMVEKETLEPFTPDWADKVKDASKANGYSWPYEVQPKLLIANPDLYTLENGPKSYKDLWEKPEFHGKYAVPTKFDGTTDRSIVGNILGQYLDEKGELGVSEEGWKAIKAFFDNGYKTPAGEDSFDNMVKGKTPITYIYAAGIQPKSQAFGLSKPATICYVTEGEPSNTNQIAVVKNSNQQVVEESLRFANWLGSAEVMGDYSARNGNIVANVDAQEQMTPLAKEIKEKFKPSQLDWTYINKMMDDWVAKIQLEIY